MSVSFQCLFIFYVFLFIYLLFPSGLPIWSSAIRRSLWLVYDYIVHDMWIHLNFIDRAKFIPINNIEYTRKYISFPAEMDNGRFQANK